MRKTVFLDRDGTINVDTGYVGKIEDFIFLPNAIAGMKQMQEIGYQLIIISNQSGIARGYYTESDYNILTQLYLDELNKKDIIITNTYFCPHLVDGEVNEYRKDCYCRKPKLGLFEKAIVECEVDINNSFCIGDNTRDLSLCKKYPSVIGILISKTGVDDFYVANDLLEASEIIRRINDERIY